MTELPARPVVAYAEAQTWPNVIRVLLSDMCMREGGLVYESDADAREAVLRREIERLRARVLELEARKVPTWPNPYHDGS